MVWAINAVWFRTRQVLWKDDKQCCICCRQCTRGIPESYLAIHFKDEFSVIIRLHFLQKLDNLLTTYRMDPAILKKKMNWYDHEKHLLRRIRGACYDNDSSFFALSPQRPSGSLNLYGLIVLINNLVRAKALYYHRNFILLYTRIFAL